MPNPLPFGLSKATYMVTLVAVAIATALVMWLINNIAERKEEAKYTAIRILPIDENTIDPAIWGATYPRQFDGYLRTVDIERTKHGGSEAFQHLDDDPRWRELFKGYPFGVDYREDRGHAYMLSDQEETERVTKFKQPGACLHCHSSVLPAYRAAALQAGIPQDQIHTMQATIKGFELVNPLPYAEARQLVKHPVACIDCHSPETMQLRITRPGFYLGIQTLAQSPEPVPHLPSVERWRKERKPAQYDPNLLASRQEMRSFVCAQCHVEYYFKGQEKLLTYPWHKGLKVEQIESYYDEVGWKDWTHKTTNALALKAQHPEFEMWSQGIHARSGVACADCHMPYKRDGALKVSDHHLQSPLLNVSRACQSCHPYAESEIKSRAEQIQDRTKALMVRTEEAVIDLIHSLEQAQQQGASEEMLKAGREFHRKSQWRLDFVAAENSMGFHAPQESARILGEALDYARQGEKALREMPSAAALEPANTTTSPEAPAVGTSPATTITP